MTGCGLNDAAGAENFLFATTPRPAPRPTRCPI